MLNYGDPKIGFTIFRSSEGLSPAFLSTGSTSGIFNLLSEKPSTKGYAALSTQEDTGSQTSSRPLSVFLRHSIFPGIMHCSCKITYDSHFPLVCGEGNEDLVILSCSVFAYLVSKLQHVNKMVRVFIVNLCPDSLKQSMQLLNLQRWYLNSPTQVFFLDIYNQLHEGPREKALLLESNSLSSLPEAEFQVV